jgi:hypothetical protein
MNRKTTPVPEPIVQLQRQLDQYRSTQTRRAKLPESLWQAAVELARQYGVHSVAQPLRLDYMRLKKRLNGTVSPRRQSTEIAFVELVSPHAAKFEECVIEFESIKGGKMRILWRASVPPDWTSLLRAWREAEA